MTIRARASTSDWNTLIYNFGRSEVQGFLIASALYWLERFHIDGLRVDAVASMLYRDYSRNAGEWMPERPWRAREPRGHRVPAAAQRSRRRALPRRDHDRRGIDRLARRDRSRCREGGLGFAYKWNMGWMHDTLHYMEQDPVHRALSPRRDDLRPDLRLLRALHPAAVP